MKKLLKEYTEGLSTFSKAMLTFFTLTPLLMIPLTPDIRDGMGYLAIPMAIVAAIFSFGFWLLVFLIIEGLIKKSTDFVVDEAAMNKAGKAIGKVGKAITGTVKSKKKESSPSSGTAFFVDDQGHIITNYHVIRSCNNNSKIIYDNNEIKVKLISQDKQLDLALLKADINNNSFIEITNNSIKKMQTIIAAGYPFGKELSDDLKLTSGSISSLKGINNNSAMLQIDAALNFGNSGGPIVDKKSGKLVGVAVAGLRKDVSEGINYGIKASQVKDFLESNRINFKTSKDIKTKDVVLLLEKATVYIFC